MLIVGWKAILEHVKGVSDKRTLRKYMEEWSLPIIYLSRRPVIVEGILDQWWLNLKKILDKKKEEAEKEKAEN